MSAILSHGRRTLLACAILTSLATLVAPPSASAKRYLRGFSDPVFTYSTADRTRWYDQSVEVGVNVVRIDMQWNTIASQDGPPANPTDPGDPSYDFAGTDQAVRDAAARGLPVLVTIQYAPRWALGKNPDTAFDGVWKPSPKALGQFVEAIATRYSGSYSPGAGQPPLPRIEYIEPWNEPNLPHYLSPQYKGKKDDKTASPDFYRKMLNRSYRGAHRGSDEVKVVGGSTAPYGDDPGKGPRVRPLRFLRDLLCLKERGRKLKKAKCRQKAKMDVISHHPISTSGGPSRGAINPDDAAIPEFKEVVELVRAAERKRTVKPRGKRPAWATEVWWETDPPDRHHGFPVAKVARWIPEMLYSLRRQDAQAVIWLQIVDSGLGGDGFGGFQSGLFDFDGNPKPLAGAWEFPFVADRLGRKRVRAWAIPPVDGRIRIERKRGAGWKRIASIKADAMKPSQKKLELRGSPKLRATIGGASSPSSKARSSSRSTDPRHELRRRTSSAEAANPELEPYVEVP